MNALPGWYQSPIKPGQYQYWDGLQWTNHFHVPEKSTHLPTQNSLPVHYKKNKSSVSLLNIIVLFIIIVVGMKILNYAFIPSPNSQQNTPSSNSQQKVMHDSQLRRNLTIAYKIAKQNSAANGGKLSDSKTTAKFINKTEPQLRTTTGKARKSSTPNLIFVKVHNNKLTLSSKSNSGRLCTLVSLKDGTLSPAACK